MQAPGRTATSPLSLAVLWGPVYRMQQGVALPDALHQLRWR